MKKQSDKACTGAARHKADHFITWAHYFFANMIEIVFK